MAPAAYRCSDLRASRLSMFWLQAEHRQAAGQIYSLFLKDVICLHSCFATQVGC